MPTSGNSNALRILFAFSTEPFSTIILTFPSQSPALIVAQACGIGVEDSENKWDELLKRSLAK